MESALTKSGLFEELKQYKTRMALYTGDVLFTGKLGHPVSGHTVIVVKGKSRTVEKLRAAKPTLRKSDTSDEVEMLQRDLDHLGFVGKDGKNLSIDGDFCSNTEHAVKSFQKGRTIKVGILKRVEKLKVDGIYGKKTYKAMKNALK
jgi:murein L,D-transpeptidase YcbB/YkuD